MTYDRAKFRNQSCRASPQPIRRKRRGEDNTLYYTGAGAEEGRWAGKGCCPLRRVSTGGGRKKSSECFRSDRISEKGGYLKCGKRRTMRPVASRRMWKRKAWGDLSLVARPGKPSIGRKSNSTVLLSPHWLRRKRRGEGIMKFRPAFEASTVSATDEQERRGRAPESHQARKKRGYGNGTRSIACMTLQGRRQRHFAILAKNAQKKERKTDAVETACFRRWGKKRKMERGMGSHTDHPCLELRANGIGTPDARRGMQRSGLKSS